MNERDMQLNLSNEPIGKLKKTGKTENLFIDKFKKIEIPCNIILI